MRYFNAVTKSENIKGLHFHGALPADVVELAEDNVFFQILPPGYRFTYGENGVPNGIEPIPLIKTALESRNEALADITWTRSDGVEIQIRHPDYAADYLLMERAKDQLAEGESRGWISKDDQPVMLSKEDMIECLAHGDSEISRIYAEYIATL